MSEGVFGGHVRTDISNVLVIGSGAAGLRAAIAAHEAGTEVVIVGKRLKKDAHTVLATGGINAALGTVSGNTVPDSGRYGERLWVGIGFRERVVA